MLSEYKEFMLGNSKESKGSSNSNAPENARSAYTPPSITKYGTGDNRDHSSDGNSNRKGKKSYRPILKAFQGRLEAFKDTNKQLESVLGSILNLRDRIHWESSRLQSLSVATTDSKDERNKWRDCGFRSSLPDALLEEDIRLALNHDLLQHERMLSSLRSLLALLAQTVDDIGRRLDEWMLLNLTELTSPQRQQRYYASPDHDSCVVGERKLMMWVNEQNLLEEAQQVYSLLALNLYRKQKLATGVLNSCHDGLLVTGDTDFSKDSFWKTNPRDVVKKASIEWSDTESTDSISNLAHNLLNMP